MNIEGKAEVRDALVEVVQGRLPLIISEKSLQGNKEASVIVNPCLRGHGESNISIKEEGRRQYPFSTFVEHLLVISRLI